jgi:hypothetical protein
MEVIVFYLYGKILWLDLISFFSKVRDLLSRALFSISEADIRNILCHLNF